LAKKIEFKSTLMFCSQNKSNYLGSEEKTPFVRYISSNKTNKDLNSACGLLEGPNFVGDLAAACNSYIILVTPFFLNR